MNRKKLISAILCVLLVTSLFSGCQAAPDTAVVVGKNDGVFESALNSSAEPVDGANMETFSYTNTFTSTDGKIEFNINDDDVQYSGNPMPVLRVTPHSITPEEAKTVYTALFGDTPAYEYTEELTKREIEEQILHYQQISDYDYVVQAVEEEYAGTPMTEEEMEAEVQLRIDARLEILAEYEELYKTAKDEIEIQECQWTFYPWSHYEPAFAGDEDLNKTKLIQATLEFDGLPFQFGATNREADNYNVQRIWVFADNTPMSTISTEEYDKIMIEENYYSKEEPTEEQAENVKQLALDYIEKMDIGEWEIAECLGLYYPYYEGYYFRLTATPIYEGISVTNLPQLSAITGQEEYDSNYYYEKVTFEFSPDGKFKYFEYNGALDVVEVPNESVAVMSFDEMTERIETQLSLDDIGMYQLFSNDPNAPAELTTDKVVMDITDMEIGFARTKVKDERFDFYLVPSVTLSGSYTAYNSGGEELYTYPETNLATPILVLNLVDGTVINYAQ